VERIAQFAESRPAHLCDLTVRPKTRAAFTEILKLSPVDILVNSAGVSMWTADTTGDEAFERIFSVNVLGTHHAMRETIQAMVAQGQRR